MDAALPAGWLAVRPNLHDERGRWLMYASDPAEKPRKGVRQHEWSAMADSEVRVVREMARCLAEIKAGRVPV